MKNKNKQSQQWTVWEKSLGWSRHRFAAGWSRVPHIEEAEPIWGEAEQEMIKARCFPKIVFSVHLYVCYKVCYMLKIFSFVGQRKFQTELRAARIRWFFLRALRASWLSLSPASQYDIIYAPKASQFNSSLIPATLLAWKCMEGRAESVHQSWGLRLLGDKWQWDWTGGSTLTPSQFPEERRGRRLQASLQGASPPLCAGSFLLLCALLFILCAAKQRCVLFKTLLVLIYCQVGFFGVFVGLSSPDCIFRPWGWFCNWGMSAWVGHKCS